MRKSLEWKKRIILVALTGVISLNFFGCKNAENKEEIAITDETNLKGVGQEIDTAIKVENINSEWKTYKALTQVTYKVQGVDKSFVMIAGLEKVEENKNLYCCLTIPEIYLEETYDKDTYTTNYRFVPMEGIKENFTKTTEITSVAFLLGGKEVYSFDEIQEMEKQAQAIVNEELDNGLGR